MTGELPSSTIAGISFIGRNRGAVKTLAGFKKGHHTLPDAANATTNAFLGKICAAELTSHAETLFQKVRLGLGYKRKDVSLNVASPAAVLTAKDFAVEFLYALVDGDPTHYEFTTTLRYLRNAELARTDEFTEIFARMFGEISFAFKEGARVEAVIDAIEALGDGSGLSVSYPSDCSECVIVVEGVAAEVHCTSEDLAMVFPKPSAPRELMAEFAMVRGAFSVSKPLARMIG